MYLLGVSSALLPLLGSCDGYDLHDGRFDIYMGYVGSGYENCCSVSAD